MVIDITPAVCIIEAMNIIHPPTKTKPPENNRGRKATAPWVAYRASLSNPDIRDGDWYEFPLSGMSMGYARRQANKLGFTTAVEGGVLKVRVPGR